MNNIVNDVAEIIEEQRFEFAYQDLCKIKYGVKTQYLTEKIGLSVYFLALIVFSVWFIMTNLKIAVLTLPVVALFWWMSLSVFFQLKLFLYLNTRWKINALLNHYSPRNSDLFRELQENVRHSPEMFFVHLKIWAAKESQYFGERPKNFVKKGLDFTEREIE